MSDLHPNHPDYVRHDKTTGEIDEDVTGQEILDPISIGALATLQRVEIDQQVATAKAYPRNVPQLKKELTALVTMDEDTADDCIYALPRGQKHIKGPSARFADALISYWGNARSGAFITQVNFEEKFVEAIGSFQDVERNVIRQRRVRRPIVTAQGRIYNTDMINMTGNAACVIAERNAILNGIPKSLWSGAYEQAFALVAGTVKTLGEKLGRAEKAFALMGITMDQVLEKLGHKDISKIVPDDIVTMRGMLTALKTGEETVETIFGRGAGTANHEHVKNPLQDDPKPQTTRGATTADASADKVTAADGTATKDRGPVSEKKQDPISSGPQAGDGVGRDGETDYDADAPKGQQVKETLPPAKETKPEAPAKPYTDADSYIAWMREILTSKGKAAITQEWGGTRKDRNDLLSPEQIDALNDEKAEALAKLKQQEK